VRREDQRARRETGDDTAATGETSQLVQQPRAFQVGQEVERVSSGQVDDVALADRPSRVAADQARVVGRNA